MSAAAEAMPGAGPRDGAGVADLPADIRAKLEPVLDEIEIQRLAFKKECDKRWKRALTVAAGVVPLCIVAYWLGWVEFQTILFVPIGIIVLMMLWVLAPGAAYRTYFKQKVLPAIAGSFGDFRYEPKGGIGMERLKCSTLIPRHDRYRHEDFFDGLYKGVEIEFCEGRLTETKGKGDNQRTVTHFDGVFVLMTMNKRFQGLTVVRRDKGSIGNWFEKMGKRQVEPVKLEDPQFEKMYEVYGSDQVEARYLLTPAFMTRLKELAEKFGTKRLEAAFYDNRLLIMLPMKHTDKTEEVDPQKLGENIRSGSVWSFFEGQIGGAGGRGLFEAGRLSESIYGSKRIREIVGEFKALVNVVDVLKLDEQTRI